jgi:hypothetical protein
MIETFDHPQGSPEWFACRAGLPTASEFSTIMARGKDGGRSITRDKYMRQLAGEIITGEPAPEGYSNGFMERGKLLEDEGRTLYAFMRDADPLIVGFIRNGQKGASPDSLIGDTGGLEIKTAIPAVQIERLERNALPPEHKPQVQGNLWVAERDWWDYCSYCPKMPPLIIRVRRDEDYIKTMAGAVERFNDELALLVERIRAYGNPKMGLREQLAASLDQEKLAAAQRAAGYLRAG